MPHNHFTHALVRYPTPQMGAGLTTQSLGAPDFERALSQYNAYLEALRACGLAVQALDGDAAFPDGHFVEDTAVIYEHVTVITQPGAPERLGEIQSIGAALAQRQPVFISGDGRVDGGDVLFCADRVLIGLSERTNLVGAEQLRAALVQSNSSVVVDFVPVRGVLHLKTGITELAPGILLRSPFFETDYHFDFAETFLLPVHEAHGANVLPINDALLIMRGYPTVRAFAQQHYENVIELDMSEFAKMDGSLTCLSLRYNG
ncbi:MAG: amidinotransferase [Anaerolineae bacterium]|nr:amidinotransferase [Anaerolineae bacterium]